MNTDKIRASCVLAHAEGQVRTRSQSNDRRLLYQVTLPAGVCQPHRGREMRLHPQSVTRQVRLTLSVIRRTKRTALLRDDSSD